MYFLGFVGLFLVAILEDLVTYEVFFDFVGGKVFVCSKSLYRKSES